MVKHIVFWKLKDPAEGADKQANARRLKSALEALNGKIPGLLRLEVGIDFNRSDAAYDIALYSELSDRAALEAYQRHPEHVAVADLVNRLRSSRAVVDYETD